MTKASMSVMSMALGLPGQGNEVHGVAQVDDLFIRLRDAVVALGDEALGVGADDSRAFSALVGGVFCAARNTLPHFGAGGSKPLTGRYFAVRIRLVATRVMRRKSPP
jgi:hypothetical protein